jgi:hypothetical protein
LGELRQPRGFLGSLRLTTLSDFIVKKWYPMMDWLQRRMSEKKPPPFLALPPEIVLCLRCNQKFKPLDKRRSRLHETQAKSGVARKE